MALKSYVVQMENAQGRKNNQGADGLTGRRLTHGDKITDVS